MRTVLSFLNMTCPACESVYTLSIEQLNVIVLFKCFECEQHNLYVAGHVLELDQTIMNEGTEDEKRRHIVEIVQAFACEFAGNVLKNVDRVINVNVEVNLKNSRRLTDTRAKSKAGKTKEIPGRSLSPSIKCADAPRISFKEMKDFVRIDLNLIDKKCFFDQFFGDHDK